MSEKTYLHLLIVCGFLSQGITASLTANDVRNSSDFLVRSKRVINHEPDGHAIPNFSDINYIVNVKQYGRSHCTGAALSYLTVITAARCVEFHIEQYQVQSGSAYAQRSQNHSIISKAVHYGNVEFSYHNGIALLKVDPPFQVGQKVGVIRLHVEPVLTGTLALVSGWGHCHPTTTGMRGQQKLRSIILPIISNRECRSNYEGRFTITNIHICTNHQQKLCALNDIGTPLVINNLLVGIHVYKGSSEGMMNPDVFLNVQDPEFSVWIRNNILYQ